MRMSDSNHLTRRRVLQATAAASVGAVGTAAAGHLEPEDCAEVVETAGAYDEGCPLADQVATLDVGEEVQVLDRCDSDTVQVAHRTRPLLGVWVKDGKLERTTC